MAAPRRPSLGSFPVSTAGLDAGGSANDPAEPREGPRRRLPRGGDWPWVVAATAGRATADERARFLAVLREAGLDRGRIVVATCHRVELHGIDAPPERAVAAAFPWRGLAVRVGPDAARHVLRLAAGLESAVVGEAQILAQVREAHREAKRAGSLDPRLDRLFQIALRVGRAARAGGSPGTDGLARRAVLALAGRFPEGRLTGRTVLVVGAGAMGRLLAAAAVRAGAEILLASRDRARAAELLGRLDAAGAALDLAAAARAWREGSVDGVLVALAGPWTEVASGGDVDDPRPEGLARRPPVVDCSAPSAIPAPIRDALGARFVGIDDLAEGPPAADAASPASVERAYRDRAEALVSEGLVEYRNWLVARSAGVAIRSLEAQAEAIRAAEVEALLRRLPDLGPRERDLVALHTRRIVARLLHPSIRRLRDGRGLAPIGERLER